MRLVWAQWMTCGRRSGGTKSLLGGQPLGGVMFPQVTAPTVQDEGRMLEGALEKGQVSTSSTAHRASHSLNQGDTTDRNQND